MDKLGLPFAVLTSILFWGVALLAIIRIYRISAGHVECVPPVGRTWDLKRFHQTDEFRVVLFALGVRLLMLAFGYAVMMVAGAEPTVAGLFKRFAWSGDCPHYLNIAEHGYAWEEVSEKIFWESGEKNILLVFFPLYPLLIRLVALFGIGYLPAAYVVAFACYIAGMVILYRLVLLDYSKTAAWWAVVLVSLAPPSFFFGIPMTEGLMLLTSALTLYCIRTHKWALAGVFGALCVFTRMVGVALIVAALAEFIAHYRIFELIKTSKWRETLRLTSTKGAWILLMPLGGIAYLLINWHISGDPFMFFHYQQAKWFNETQYFGKTLITQFEYIANDPRTNTIAVTFIPNVIAFTLAIAALVYASAERMPTAYIVYMLGYVFVSFAPSWLLSGQRYMLVCVPLFIVSGHIAEKKRTPGIALLILFIAGLSVLTATYVTGGGVF
jgi:hypothetical protein